MKTKLFLMIIVTLLIAGCGHVADEQPFDGRLVTLKGRWNSLSKEAGQLIGDSEPRIVDVINIGDRSVPNHNRYVKVVAILHWREESEEDNLVQDDNLGQDAFSGYIIDWSKAHWDYLEK